jgi:hypothetical protein
MDVAVFAGVWLTRRVGRNVAVGVAEAVTVAEAVMVAAGPRSAPWVKAMAVLVRLAFCTSASLDEPFNEFQSSTIKAMNKPEAPKACK